MSDPTSVFLFELSKLPDFRISRKSEGEHSYGLIFHAGGSEFDGSFYCMEEDVREAYLALAVKCRLKKIMESAR